MRGERPSERPSGEATRCRALAKMGALETRRRAASIQEEDRLALERRLKEAPGKRFERAVLASKAALPPAPVRVHRLSQVTLSLPKPAESTTARRPELL